MAGVIYVTIVIRRARLQTGYKPDLGDWMWHAGLPLLAYTAFVLAAFALQSSPAMAFFIIGAAALLLLFIGIHNAWDTVVWHVFVRKREHRESERPR